MIYYQIDTGHGYPSRFLCRKHFDLKEELAKDPGIVAERVSHHEKLTAATQDVGTWCDVCNAPLAKPSTRVRLEPVTA